MEENKKRTKNEWTLIYETILLSNSNNWDDSKKEWMIADVKKQTTAVNCICGKFPIFEVITMNNKNNHNKIIVGNCCVNRFFNNTSQNKVFSAIRKGKINDIMINFSFEKGIITDWERDFTMNVWRKRKLSYKQSQILVKITQKILNFYKK